MNRVGIEAVEKLLKHFKSLEEDGRMAKLPEEDREFATDLLAYGHGIAHASKILLEKYPTNINIMKLVNLGLAVPGCVLHPDDLDHFHDAISTIAGALLRTKIAESAKRKEKKDG